MRPIKKKQKRVKKKKEKKKRGQNVKCVKLSIQMDTQFYKLFEKLQCDFKK